MIYLDDIFSELWRDKDPFAEVLKLDGKVYRALEGRRTLRFEVDGVGYFLKYHTGVGWGEIVKNLLQGRAPVLGAENEYRAVNKLRELGVGTMQVAAFGSRGCNPAKRESFIITRAIEPSQSLEELAEFWRNAPPMPVRKRELIERVATMAGKMHAGGVNHRDFYICHFLLDERDDLFIIDLHRALIHDHVPYRWLLKDLASIYYSAHAVNLTRRDKLRFVRAYSRAFKAENLRQALEIPIWVSVEKKAAALYAKARRKGLVVEQ